MKANLKSDYTVPEIRVIYTNCLNTIMVTSSNNASSESFQNESGYTSIW